MKIDPTAISEARQLATEQAWEASTSGPLSIIEQGRPTHVLVTVEHYRRLETEAVSSAEAHADRDGDDIEFDFSRTASLVEPACRD